MKDALDERGRRLWAASEARAAGRGGISAVHRATGMAWTTIEQGLRDLESVKRSKVTGAPAAAFVPAGHVRLPGGGRKKTVALNPQLLTVLEELVSSSTRRDPMCALRWTCKRVRHLAEELKSRGFQCNYQTVASLLHEMDYSLQANVKTNEGASHEHRDAQFSHISTQVTQMQNRGQPVISVDTKKKEFDRGFQEQRMGVESEGAAGKGAWP